MNTTTQPLEKLKLKTDKLQVLVKTRALIVGT